MSLFELDQVSFRYQKILALDGLSLTVPDRTRVALLGANGSGKSTLLRIFAGLYFAESGSAKFRGQVLSEEQFGDDSFAFDFRKRVGMVFQNPDVQLFNPTVFDEVAFGPLQLRWPKDKVRDGCRGHARQAAHRPLERSRAASPLGRREEARGAGQRAGARSGGAAARRADGRARSAQPEPDHRSAGRVGRRRKVGDHGDARSGYARRHRRPLLCPRSGPPGGAGAAGADSARTARCSTAPISFTSIATGTGRRSSTHTRTCIAASTDYNNKMASDKTFYIETFGCQMNAHDSEKVIGTLLHQGYTQVDTPEAADLVLYNTCSIRDKAEQKVFHRLEQFKRAANKGKIFAVIGCVAQQEGRADLREGAAREPGGRVGQLHQAAGDAGATRSRQPARHRAEPRYRRDLRHAVHAPRQSASRLHHHHRRLRQVLRLLRGPVHARAGAQPHQRERAARSAKHWPPPGTPRSSCSART